ISITTPIGRQATPNFSARENLEFAERPQDAPIVHFAGPLTMDLAKSALIQGEMVRLVPRIGTTGLGKGTFARVAVDCFYPALAGKTPRAGLEFPSNNGPIRAWLKFNYAFIKGHDG